MPIIHVEVAPSPYDIVIEPGGLDDLGRLVCEVAPHERCALLADANVAAIYGSRAAESLQRAGYDVTTAAIPPGESHKTLDTVRAMYDAMLDAKLERRSPVIALGGGVVGDTAGFVAATYLRGVPFVQCPTSLLAMVDASVGGKVGVNVPQGKNLIGAFYQPSVVVMDPLLLATLPPRELRCGLAECVKHAMIRSESLFNWIAEKLPHIQANDPATLVELLQRNVRIKATIVMEDPTEQNVRAHLNFGHTFAHAIEATAGYGVIEHGEAVALGMIAATKLSIDLGRCDPAVLEQLTALLQAIGLPTHASLAEIDRLMGAMRLDKKVKHDRIRFVVTDGIGQVEVIDNAPESQVRAAWASIGAA